MNGVRSRLPPFLMLPAALLRPKHRILYDAACTTRFSVAAVDCCASRPLGDKTLVSTTLQAVPSASPCISMRVFSHTTSDQIEQREEPVPRFAAWAKVSAGERSTAGAPVNLGPAAGTRGTIPQANPIRTAAGRNRLCHVLLASCGSTGSVRVNRRSGFAARHERCRLPGTHPAAV